jgi:hypothetical protein
VGDFLFVFLEGGTRRPLHETKICQFIELKVGNRKMVQTFFFPPFSSLKAMSSSLAISFYIYAMSLSHWLFAISFSLYQ